MYSNHDVFFCIETEKIIQRNTQANILLDSSYNTK